MAKLNIFETDISSLPIMENVTRQQFDETIRPAGKPVILRGLVKDWPAVQSGQKSPDEIGNYLKQMDNQKPAMTFVAPPEVKGRYFYAPDMRGFNFEKRQIPLSATIDKLLEQKNTPDPLSIYAGATSASDLLPGFGVANPMPLVSDEVSPLVWIGNSARIAPHYDTSENIACAVAGTRKFLVFPPHQIDNLYVGPLEHTVAGQPVSLVDPQHFDAEAYPKFESAMREARVAHLKPGDAIYLPALWWHYVESAGPLNVLVNYWWNSVDKGPPMSALALSMLILRELPPAERAAWKHIFDHYIFKEEAQNVVSHLPEHAQGVLGKSTPQRDSTIKNFVGAQLQKLFSEN
ncbi:cupin-like domain-containing protein [Litorimonas sp.]|uniref:cupin-like domain-containing protein n=1 Tax=Litorimonas sp. TaxID=1892381 RepID=UPI003A8B61FB